jgi:predicted RNA-binding Zn-ribbon protein involved in translation (DUF1610 family)
VSATHVFTVAGASIAVTASTPEQAQNLARDIEAAIRPEPVGLGCNHCGADAITSVTAMFWDGEGERCESCGFPGHVSADEDSAYWVEADEGRCTLDDCHECRGHDDCDECRRQPR